MTEQEQPPETNPEAGPLAETSANSMEELFRRDPLELTDQDVFAIVQEYRNQRVEFQKEENRKKTQGKQSKPADGQVSLDDLDLSDD